MHHKSKIQDCPDFNHRGRLCCIIEKYNLQSILQKLPSLFSLVVISGFFLLLPYITKAQLTETDYYDRQPGSGLYATKIYEDDQHALLIEGKYYGDKAELLYVTRLITIDKRTGNPQQIIQIRDLLIKKGLDKNLIFPRWEIHDGKIALSGGSNQPLIFNYTTGELLAILGEQGMPYYWDDKYLLVEDRKILRIYTGLTFKKKATIEYQKNNKVLPKINQKGNYFLVLTEDYDEIKLYLDKLFSIKPDKLISLAGSDGLAGILEINDNGVLKAKIYSKEIAGPHKISKYGNVLNGAITDGRYHLIRSNCFSGDGSLDIVGNTLTIAYDLEKTFDDTYPEDAYIFIKPAWQNKKQMHKIMFERVTGKVHGDVADGLYYVDFSTTYCIPQNTLITIENGSIIKDDLPYIDQTFNIREDEDKVTLDYNGNNSLYGNLIFTFFKDW